MEESLLSLIRVIPWRYIFGRVRISIRFQFSVWREQFVPKRLLFSGVVRQFFRRFLRPKKVTKIQSEIKILKNLSGSLNEIKSESEKKGEQICIRRRTSIFILLVTVCQAEKKVSFFFLGAANKAQNKATRFFTQTIQRNILKCLL